MKYDVQIESLKCLINAEISALRKMVAADNIDLDDVISCAYRLKRYKKMRKQLKSKNTH